MTGRAASLPLFSLGFDCLEPVSSEVAAAAAAAGYSWCGRYLHTLSPDEVAGLFDANLSIALLTFAPEGAALSASTGDYYGRAAVSQARALGVPDGVHVTIDLESPPLGSDCPAHVNAFARQLFTAKLEPMLYVGVPQPLSGPELYALPTNRYWKGGGSPPEPSVSWAILQLEPLDQTMFGGQRVDVNVSQADRRGRRAVVWSRGARPGASA